MKMHSRFRVSAAQSTLPDIGNAFGGTGTAALAGVSVLILATRASAAGRRARAGRLSSRRRPDGSPQKSSSSTADARVPASRA